jgi:hypothetical protein
MRSRLGSALFGLRTSFGVRRLVLKYRRRFFGGAFVFPANEIVIQSAAEEPAEKGPTEAAQSK